ncbi:uncharacterized protein LOC126092833 [Schistocerca cancellata]|uniref:uncharacterized protein LOC126092833 n=1 Tax=Schistocerca cancellata TaxID=274614 RepID=UPI00211892A8|nr:uncharacterized protein LOC126092833 [Schistocerca cancellata]
MLRDVASGGGSSGMRQMAPAGEASRAVAAVPIDVSEDQSRKKIISLLSSYRGEKDKLKNSMGTGLKLEKGPCNKSDEIDAFVTYIAANVKKYSPETQKSVQHAVFDVLLKADKGF